MDEKLPYDEWNRHVHAIITFLKPFFNDWRSYVSLASMLLGIGVLIMENQVLLRMRMGRWEVAGYVICKKNPPLHAIHAWKFSLHNAILFCLDNTLVANVTLFLRVLMFLGCCVSEQTKNPYVLLCPSE